MVGEKQFDKVRRLPVFLFSHDEIWPEIRRFDERMLLLRFQRPFWRVISAF
jgi:hypothetical protein